MRWIQSRTAGVALVVTAVVALSIALGMWHSWPAQAQPDLIVNDDNDPAVDGCDSPDYSTIQLAVDHSSDGDTLVLCEGTYDGDVTVDKSVTIEGRAEADRDNIVVEGASNGFNVTADGVTVRHIRFDGVDDTDNGIWVTGDDATIQGVEALRWDTGIWLDGSSGSVVEDSDVHDNSYAGIYAEEGGNNVIRGNVAGPNTPMGVGISEEDVDLVVDNELWGTGDALYLAAWGAGARLNVHVLRNTIHATTDGIFIERIPSADSLIVIGGRAEDANTFEGSPNTAAGDFFLEMKCGAGPPDSEVTVNATWNYWGGSTARSAIAALIYDDEDDNECGTPHGAVVFHPWATEPAPTPSPSPTPTPTPSPTPSPTPVADTRDFDLPLGWNNFVWTGADATAADTALNCIAGNFAIAYALEAGGWLRYVPGQPDITTLATVDKYDSLLVLVTASGVQCLGMPVDP